MKQPMKDLTPIAEGDVVLTRRERGEGAVPQQGFHLFKVFLLVILVNNIQQLLLLHLDFSFSFFLYIDVIFYHSYELLYKYL